MKNKMLITKIILCISMLFTLFLVLYSVRYPFYKPFVYGTSKGEILELEEGKEYVTKVFSKDKYVSGLQIDSITEVNGIKLLVEVYKGDTLYYKNTFTNLNQFNSVISFKEPLVKVKKVKVVMKLLESNGNTVLLRQNKYGHIAFPQISRTKSYRITYFSTMAFTVEIIAFLFLIKKEKNKSEKRFLLKIILYFVLSLSLAFLTLYLAYSGYYLNGIRLRYIMLIILLIISLAYIFVSEFNLKLPYQKMFLLLSIPIASFYCVLCMPGDSFDENLHYAKSYAIINSETFKNYVHVPDVIDTGQGLGNVSNLFEKMSYKGSKIYKEKFYNIAVPKYTFTAYTISSISLFIGKFLKLNPYLGWYIAKIFNFIFFEITGYFIIKKMPKFKMLTLLYLMMPMMLYQVTSISADAFIIIGNLFLIAHMLSIYYDKNRIFKWYDYLILVIFGTLSISKIVYIPILIVLLLINIKKIFKNKKTAFMTILSLFLVIAIYLLYQKSITLNNNTILQSVVTYNANLSGFSYFINNFLNSISTMFNYILSNIDLFISNFIGYRFVWGTSSTPHSFAWFYLLMMLLSCVVRDDNDNIALNNKILFILATFVVCSSIFLAMFLFSGRSNIYTGYMWGVQGRYFIPIYILLFLCINKLSIKKNEILKVNNLIFIVIGLIHFLYIYKLLGFTIY